MDNMQSNTIPTITTDEIEGIIKTAMAANKADPTAQIALSLEGDPGTAKTAIPAAVAKAMGWGFTPIAVPHLDIVEGKGFPIYNAESDTVVFKAIDIWPREKGDQILLLDELAQGTPPVQASLSGLLQGGHMGNYTLPEGTLIITTGNLQSNKAATYRMPSHLKSRLCRFNVTVSADNFLSYAKRHGMHRSVLEFIANKPQLLHDFDAEADLYPSLRGWHKISALMQSGADSGTIKTMASATVGIPAAAEFDSWITKRVKLPSPAQILQNPAGCQIPSDPGDLQTLATSMAKNISPERADAFLTYIQRFDGEYQEVFKMTARQNQKAMDIDRVSSFTAS